jgi:hypothetical protein
MLRTALNMLRIISSADLKGKIPETSVMIARGGIHIAEHFDRKLYNIMTLEWFCISQHHITAATVIIIR